jgi:HSP20 family protein
MSPPTGSYGHIHHLRAEINRLIDLLLEEPTSPTANWQPPLDMVEHEDGFEVRIELPGVQADDLQLELRDLTLHVRGTKARLASEPPGQRFHLMERFMGSFTIRIDLPRPILPAKSSARLCDGLLVVTLPRLVERRHRTHTIPIVEESASDE